MSEQIFVDRENANAFKVHQLDLQREKFKAACMSDDNSNFRGCAWGIINAYIDFITHKAPQGNSATKDEGKFMTVTFHPGLMNAIFNSMAAAGVAI